MTAKEFDKSTKGKYNQATYDFAESYFKARVNEITDEEIEKLSNEISTEVGKYMWDSGAKWLKQKLLEG